MGLASGKELQLSTASRQLVQRKQIDEIEAMLHALPEEDKIPPEDVTQHYFADHVYARMIFVPAGHLIVGKIHRDETMNIVCKGKISVTTEDGPVIFEGPCVVNSAPGTKKAAYAITDTWWVNIHVTDETDLDIIESQVIVKDYEQLEHKSEE
jgi:hypothetical protein